MPRACTTRASARAVWPAPRARDTSDAVLPPMAPPENICCNISSGNTRAMPASAATPSWPTYAVSAIAATALPTIATMLGIARRHSVGSTGAVSKRLAEGADNTAMSQYGWPRRACCHRCGWPTLPGRDLTSRCHKDRQGKTLASDNSINGIWSATLQCKHGGSADISLGHLSDMPQNCARTAPELRQPYTSHFKLRHTEEFPRRPWLGQTPAPGSIRRWRQHHPK